MVQTEAHQVPLSASAAAIASYFQVFLQSFHSTHAHDCGLSVTQWEFLY